MDGSGRERPSESREQRIERLERELAEARSSAPAVEVPPSPERLLADSERRFRLLVESSSDVVLIADPDRFRYASPSIENVLGYEPSWLVGRVAMELVHPDDAEVAGAFVGQLLSAPNAVARAKLRLRHADGTYRVIELTGTNLLHEEAVRGVVVNMRDVTEREHTQEELRRSEGRLRERERMLDAAQTVGRLGSFRRTFGTANVELSREMSRFFGPLPPSLEIPAQEAGDRIHPDDRPAVHEAIRRCLEGGDDAYSVEHRVCRPDGVERWVKSDGKMVRDAAGVPLQIIGTMLDITDRKYSEQHLAERERRFRVLVESSADVVCISSGKVLTYVSTAVQGVLGFAPEELLRKDLTEFIHPDERDRARELRQRLLEDPALSPVRTKLRIRHKTDGFRVVELVVRYLVDDPAIRGLAINFHDVTDREAALDELKQSDAILRESRRTLEKAQAIAHIGSWTFDIDGREVMMSASEETFNILGVDPASFDGRLASFEGCFEPAEWARITGLMDAAIAAMRPFTYDASFKRGDGLAWVHVEGIVEKTSSGATRVFGTTLDITDRVRSEDELRASEARYRRIIETTSEGVWLIGLEGRTAFVNARMAAMLGYSAAEMSGRLASDFLAGPRPTHAEAHYERLRNGATEMIDYQLRHSDGSTRWVTMATSQLVGDAGEHEGVLAMVTDITERRQAEERREKEQRRAEQAEESLRDAEEQLRQAQKLEALGQLAGGVAHDFNNILSVILGYTSILKDDIPEHDPAHADVSEIHDAGMRASDLTRQLLAFSRKQVLQPRAVDLGTIVLRTERMLRRLLGEDIELVFVQASSPLTVNADPGQLEQVLVNLAVNARDAMPNGGRLTIETARTHLGPDEARPMGLAPGDHMLLTVTDTGIGMDEGVARRVFEPFFTTKEMGKGTGLGLSTVFGIVKQSAGHVLVESTPGSGTTFRVFLPATDAPAETEADSVPAPRARTGETILLVEDEDQVRALARNVLRRSGYRVLEAANAGEALLVSEAHDGRIDLLLTDVVMPRMGGHQLASKLGPMRPEMKILYVSGYTDDTVLRHGVELGQLAFLAKPFTSASLVAKVRDVLEAEVQAQKT